jgi:uncharacterized protein YndB with AHSA1/START domain
MLRARIIRWLGGLAVIATIGAMGVTGAGSVMPEEQTSIRGILVNAAPDAVWNVLTDYPLMRRWNPGVADVAREADDEGKPVWRLTSANGSSMRVRIEQAQPNEYYELQVLDAGLFEGSWSFQLMQQPKGTYVKLTQVSHIPNPLVRFFANYVARQDGGMRQFLEAVGRKFGKETPTIDELVQ